ncbi:hypothetical protein MRX96_012375 [Rhipicephalus microplus]
MITSEYVALLSPKTWGLGAAAILTAAMGTTWWYILPQRSLKKLGKRHSKEHSIRTYIAHSENLPPIFPNGWIPVLESSALGLNDVVPLPSIRTPPLLPAATGRGCGSNWSAVRSAPAHAVENCLFIAGVPEIPKLSRGYRPRLFWLHLLQCPFHGWKFQADTGVCTDVPYASQTPSFVKVKTWICQESCGLIIVWFHAEEEEPSWMIEYPAEVVSGRMRQMARYEKICSGHIQDIAQKVADGAHMNSLHAATCLLSLPEFASRPRDSWLCRLMQLKWDTKFAVDW